MFYVPGQKMKIKPSHYVTSTNYCRDIYKYLCKHVFTYAHNYGSNLIKSIIISLNSKLHTPNCSY